MAGFSREALKAVLSAPLFPLDCPISDLPVAGYCPEAVTRPRPAAVLVGVTAGREPGIVLTLRSRQLAHHAGQVSFPGGGRDAPGESVVQTALREAHEEAGIEQHRVRPLGFLGRYDTITGYRMTAVVALLDAGISFTPDHNEVDAVFTVPLVHVMDPDRYRRDRIRYAGREFEIVTLEHPEHHIWGATAALLADFGSRLSSAPADPDDIAP
ncbi:MAG: CoA pyrophosphatase [Wenzhouxiangellaceae bacterium]